MLCSNNLTHKELKHMYYAIRAFLYIECKLKEPIWNPIWMIDKGSAELRFMEATNQLFVLCKFHIIKALKEWFKSNVPNEQKAALCLKYVYQLYNCTKEDLYMKLYSKMKEDSNVPSTFLNYFDSYWHTNSMGVYKDKFYMHWTGILRESNFGSWGTDNIIYLRRNVCCT